MAANGMSSAKRFLVRLSLVTGSTMATIIGAQNLAMIDTAKGIQTAAQQANTAQSTTTNTSSSFVQAVAPSVTIVRHSSSGTTSTQTIQSSPSTQTVTIQPPSPVTITSNVRSRTRSSR